MATQHFVLAKVQNSGVAKIFYGHPAIQKTSLILNNKAIISQEVGEIVKLSIKMMPSGKRILLSSRKFEGTSIENFIFEVGEGQMIRASEREASDGKWAKIEKFDGEDDKSYLVSKHILPRFSGDTPTSQTEIVEEELGDGYVHFGELYIPEIVTRTLRAMGKIAQTVGAVNVLLVGPSGNGKTTLAKAFADANGMEFLKVNCSTIRDPEEWYGYREAREGSTVFIPTDFTELVRKGNAVILLDELNRLEPYLHNSLMALLDETRHTKVHGEDIIVGNNVVFMGTMNLGAGFVGTFVLDSAIKNRMDATIKMEKLSSEREIALLIERTGIARDAAKQIVSMLDKVRNAAARNEIDIDVSPRSSLKIARMVGTTMLEVKEAITLAVFNNAESIEQSKALIDSLLGGS